MAVVLGHSDSSTTERHTHIAYVQKLLLNGQGGMDGGALDDGAADTN